MCAVCVINEYRVHKYNILKTIIVFLSWTKTDVVDPCFKNAVCKGRLELFITKQCQAAFTVNTIVAF